MFRLLLKSTLMPICCCSSINFCILFLLSQIFSGIALFRGNDPIDHGNQCAGSCITEMQTLIDSTPFFKTTAVGNGGFGKSIVAMTKNSFFERSSNGNGEPNYTLILFNQICELVFTINAKGMAFSTTTNAYDKVDVCLVKCEASKQAHHSPSSRQTDETNNNRDIRQAYAGLHFICKERKKDFFEALPCLAEYEPGAMLKCNIEINKSQDSTLLFTNAIINREFQAIALRFSTLCRDLSQMMKCMEPTIRRGCGDKPTNLMLAFIGLEFSSFEKLNEQLGFEHPLPNSCRSLIHYSNERRLKNQGARGRYSNSASLRNQDGTEKNRNYPSYLNPNGCAKHSYPATCTLILISLATGVFSLCYLPNRRRLS